ncbi:unnamed protein product [Amoebophrya sp. A120]|nr:unnamed protein product [Amoebophrya sp. A120]|eukprot:GSA120T00021560001.1
MAHLLLQRDSKSGKTLLLDAMDAHLDTRSGRIYHVLSAESASRLDFVWQLAVTFLTPGQMRKLLLTRARDGRTVLHAAAQLATHEVAWDSQVLSARDDRAQRATGGEEVLERSLQLRLIANWLSVKEQRTLLFKTHTQVSSGVMVDVARGREEDPRYSAWINSARYSEKDRAEAEGVANMVLAPYRNSGEEAGSVILRVLDESCAAVAPARSAAASTTTAAVARSGSSSALPQRTGVALEKCLARNEESLLYARTEGGASRLGVIRLAAPSTVEWILQKVRADDRKVVRAREMKRFEPHLKDGPVFRLGEPSREHLRNCLEAHRLCRQFAFLLHAAGNPDEPVYLTNRRSDGNPDEPFYRVSGLKPSTRLRVLLNLMAYNKGPTDATALADPASLQHTYDAFRGYEQGPDLPFRLLDSGSGSERAALLWVWHNLVRHTTLFREIRHTIWEAYAVATIPKKYLNAHQITTREEEMEMLKRDISTKVRLGEQSADPHPAHLEKCLELYLSCHKFAFLLHHTDGAAGEIPLHSAAAGGDLPAVATMLGVRLRGSSEGRDATSHQLGLEGEQNAGAVRALDWVREKLLLAETKSTDSPTLGSPGKTVHDLLLDQWRATISTYNQNADPVEHLARLLHATLMQPRGSGDSLLQLERIILYTKAHNGGSGLHTASGARLDWFLERIWLDRQNVVATTEMEHFDKGSYLRESGAPEREGVDACLKTDGRCRQFAFLLHAVDASGSTALHMAGEKRDFSKAEQLIGRKQLNFIWSATSRTVNALKPFGDPGKDHSNNDRALGWIWKLLLNKPNNEGRAAKDVFASASEAWYKEKGQTAVSESIGKLRKMFKELQPFS